MWARAKCWWLGHRWKLVGKSTVQQWHDTLPNPIAINDYFFHICRRCGDYREYKAATTYQYFDSDQQEEVKINE